MKNIHRLLFLAFGIMFLISCDKNNTTECYTLVAEMTAAKLTMQIDSTVEACNKYKSIIEEYISSCIQNEDTLIENEFIEILANLDCEDFIDNKK